MKNIFIAGLVSILLSSCEKEIDIDLNSADPQVVIEGSVTDGPGPHYVKISESVNFSDANVYPPVSEAVVVISDNLGIIDTLTESSSGIYQTHTITGVPGNKYELNVQIGESKYFASSIMPQKVKLDSLRFEPLFAPGSESLYSVLPVYVDPETLGNNYRFLVSVNGKKNNSYIVDNDVIGNGTTNDFPIFDPEMEILSGDTVTVEMRCIDLSTYNYFYSLAQISGGGPGGGTTPANPTNNIYGGAALGVFSAYTVEYKSEVVP